MYTFLFWYKIFGEIFYGSNKKSELFTLKATYRAPLCTRNKELLSPFRTRHVQTGP